MAIDGTHVETSYGHHVRVYESTATIAPHCWLGILDGSQSVSAHLNVAQAIAVRDRLNTFIDQASGGANE